MPDTQEANSASAAPLASEKSQEPRLKAKAARVKKAEAGPKRRGAMKAAKPASVAAEAAPARGKRRNYPAQERAQKLAQIEKAIGRGVSIRSAVGQAGISEQTYYLWKKAAAAARPGSELRDLAALEEENVRLKKLLAERLRAENAELKKKLGLA